MPELPMRLRCPVFNKAGIAAIPATGTQTALPIKEVASDMVNIDKFKVLGKPMIANISAGDKKSYLL